MLCQWTTWLAMLCSIIFYYCCYVINSWNFSLFSWNFYGITLENLFNCFPHFEKIRAKLNEIEFIRCSGQNLLRAILSLILLLLQTFVLFRICLGKKYKFNDSTIHIDVKYYNYKKSLGGTKHTLGTPDSQTGAQGNSC